jgi:ABC-type transport system substrate-binding protein
MSIDGVLTGHLVETWDASADGKSITFHLRKGIKFHDGTPFNAEAVKYNLEATANSGLWGTATLKIVKSYDVLDVYTLRANVDGYDYTFMSSLAELNGLMASPTALQKPATAETISKLHMVGTGPFIFDSFKRDDYVKYTKNPDYWQPGKPYLDAVIMRYVADRTVRLMVFQAGEASALGAVDPVDADMLEKQGYMTHILGMRFQHAMMCSSANPASPFANKKVREALYYAIDSETLIEGIGGGAKRGYVPLYTIAEPSNAWYMPELKPRTYDPEKAKQLLAEAGYPNGFKTNLITNTLVELDWPEALQTALKKVGIETTLDIADVPRFYDIAMSGWEGLLHPGFPTMSTISGLYSRWADPSYYGSMYKPAGWDDMWNAVIHEPNDAKRLELMKAIVRLDYSECVTFSYRANSPLGEDAGNIYQALDDGTDIYSLFHIGGAMDSWWPEAVWIAKLK